MKERFVSLQYRWLCRQRHGLAVNTVRARERTSGAMVTAANERRVKKGVVAMGGVAVMSDYRKGVAPMHMHLRMVLELLLLLLLLSLHVHILLMGHL